MRLWEKERQNSMKAIIYDQYGSPDVLELEEVDKPIVKDGEVLVRVRAVSLNPYDWHFMTGLPYIGRLSFGLLNPKARILGADFAGQVEAVGKNVTRFRPGDDVFGGVETGAFAEFVCAPKDSVALKPAVMSFEHAAAVPMAALTALQGLRDHGELKPGQKVLINGASGGVGTFAVQIAKSIGAEVTGVCSGRNGEMVRSLGADRVIDYTREDFTIGEQRYDLMLDNIGNRSISECRRILKPKGIYLSSFGQPENLWFGPVLYLLKMITLSLFVSQTMRTFVATMNTEDLITLRELVEAGSLTPAIDRTYPLSEIRQAMRHLEAGHARGKVVISV
jgi:NADPH:quinone reductase-like Zn-dependent oxidoreductase